MMNRLHTIRLRGPWTCFPAGASPHSPHTIHWPSRKSGEQRSDSVVEYGDSTTREMLARWHAERWPMQWVRTFNRPSGLTEADRLWLSVETEVPLIAVQLNGNLFEGSDTLGGSTHSLRQVRIEITSRLANRNELQLTLCSATSPSDVNFTDASVGQPAAEVYFPLRVVQLEIASPTLEQI